jgi:hypothetical protein
MADRPAVGDVIHMGRALRRGSVIDAPKSVLGIVREVLSDTPADSPLTLKALLRRADYRQLMTAKIAVGDRAFDFELPPYDFSQGTAVRSGPPVRLSAFRDVQPVALVFGSYT